MRFATTLLWTVVAALPAVAHAWSIGGSSSSSSSINKAAVVDTSTTTQQPVTTATTGLMSRRTMACKTVTAVATGAAFVVTVTAAPSPALAKDKLPPATPENIAAAYAKVRAELETGGGIPTIKKLAAASDFVGLMEFTKTYDLNLRKIKMGFATKLAQARMEDEAEAKAFSVKCTSMRNAVTFDLIGINRNSRPGQENKEQAEKYVQELVDDVTAFLEYLPPVPLG